MDPQRSLAFPPESLFKPSPGFHHTCRKIKYLEEVCWCTPIMWPWHAATMLPSLIKILGSNHQPALPYSHSWDCEVLHTKWHHARWFHPHSAATESISQNIQSIIQYISHNDIGQKQIRIGHYHLLWKSVPQRLLTLQNMKQASTFIPFQVHIASLSTWSQHEKKKWCDIVDMKDWWFQHVWWNPRLGLRRDSGGNAKLHCGSMMIGFWSLPASLEPGS